MTKRKRNLDGTLIITPAVSLSLPKCEFTPKFIPSEARHDQKKRYKLITADVPKLDMKLKSSMPKKNSGRKVTFCPGLKVFEFDSESPSMRHMEVKEEDIDSLEANVVYMELLSRGVKINHVEDVEMNPYFYQKLLKKHFWHEHARELESFSISPEGDVSELRSQCRLLRVLIQRCYVSSICRNTRKEPMDMNTEAIIQELEQHRIKWSPKEKASLSRKNLIEHLELALIKSCNGLKIIGYELGKTLVTAQDIVEYNFYLNASEEGEIDEIEMLKEEERVEESLQLKFRQTLIDVIHRELRIRKIKLSGMEELVRSKSFGERAENKMSRLFSFLKSIPNPARSEEDELAEEQMNELNKLFKVLFKSKMWDLEYADIE